MGGGGMITKKGKMICGFGDHKFIGLFLEQINLILIPPPSPINLCTEKKKMIFLLWVSLLSFLREEKEKKKDGLETINLDLFCHQ